MKEEIKDIILTLLEEEDVYIESLTGGDGGEKILLILDTDSGIPFDTLAKISSRIRHNQGFIDAGGEDYELEVSSPGVDSPLSLPRHFRKNIGRSLRITHSREDIPSPLKAVLNAADDEGINLSPEKKGVPECRLDYADILEAKVKLKW